MGATTQPGGWKNGSYSESNVNPNASFRVQFNFFITTCSSISTILGQEFSTICLGLKYWPVIENINNYHLKEEATPSNS